MKHGIDDDAEQSAIYNRILVVLKEQDAHIHNTMYACLDVILTCLINEAEGDVKIAADNIDKVVIPILKNIKQKMDKGEMSIKHMHIAEVQATVNQLDAGTNPILANMDIQGKKAN